MTAGECRWQLAVPPEVGIVAFVVHLHNRLPFLGVPVYKETITPFRWPNATRSSFCWFTTFAAILFWRGVEMVICHYGSSAASMAKISTSMFSANTNQFQFPRVNTLNYTLICDESGFIWEWSSGARTAVRMFFFSIFLFYPSPNRQPTKLKH